MKKIFLGFALILGSLAFGQDYYDTYPQSEYNGYEYYDSNNSYPDDYYYNYPTDYYPDDYYQGYYNDYRNSVASVNWNNFFVQFNLSPWQINQITILNNRFASYAAWNSYYRWNPDRWYYDRFLALQNIMGPQVFVVYQNTYFRGRSPIVFFKNRFTNYYAVKYPVRPVYRNVNINIYRVDRNNFRNGFREPIRNHVAVNSPRVNANPRIENGNIRTNSGVRDNIRYQNGDGGVRNNSGVRDNVRGQRDSSVRNMPNVRTEVKSNNGGIRNSSPRGMENNSRSNGRGNEGGRSQGIRIANR